MLYISGYWANLPVTWKIWLSKVIPHIVLFCFFLFQQFWEIVSYNWLIVDSYGNVHKSWVTPYYLMNFTSLSLWKVRKLFVVTTVLGINLNHWKACVFPLNDGTFVRKMHLRVDQESWVAPMKTCQIFSDNAKQCILLLTLVLSFWYPRWIIGVWLPALVSMDPATTVWNLLQAYYIWLIWVGPVL